MHRTLLAGLLLLSPGTGIAEPVDFRDPQPRWIQVEFEISPRDKPAQKDTIYTPRIRAWLEPTVSQGLMKVTVDRGDVERMLFADDDPVAGSFTDFVWIFDAATGEVISAELSGSLMKEIHWGLFRTKVRTKVDVEMATSRVGGFRQPRRLLGQDLFGYCDDEGSGDCTLVAADGYDASTGHVNAVGDLAVHFGEVRIRAFSPLGEAVFSEFAPAEPAPSASAVPGLLTGASESTPFDDEPTPAVSSGPPPAP